jgi:photosystem II stability/assembly factor-like uncharacterized protein
MNQHILAPSPLAKQLKKVRYYFSVVKSLLVTILFIGLIPGIYAQWEQVNGPFGAGVQELVTNNTSIYARLAGQGLASYKSNDNGNSWTSMSDSLPENGFLNPSRIAVNDSVFFIVGSNSEERILRTRDEGLTWENASYGLPGNFQMLDFYITGRDLFLGTWTGVYHSGDEGESWTEANTGLTNIWIWKFCSHDSVVYGITNEGEIYKTVNYGQLWETVNTAWLPFLSYPVAFTIVNNIFYAGTTSGIYSISVADTAWDQRNNGLTDTIVNALIADGNMLYAGTSSLGVFQSPDGGSNWIQVSDGLLFKYVTSLVIKDSMIFSGTDGGAYRADRSTMLWSPANEGMHHQTVGGLTGHDSILFAGTNLGVYRSFDNGEHWELPVNLPELYRINTLAYKHPYIFAGTSNNPDGGFLRSSDNGTTWTLCNQGLGNINTRCFIVGDTELYIGTEDGIYLSTDEGLHWSLVCADHNVFSMAKVDSVFFLADFGYEDGGFYRSTDNGITWTILNNGIPPDQEEVTIVIKDTMVYAGTMWYAGGIYKMPVLGDTWTPCISGLTSSVTRVLVVNDTTLFAGTYISGIFLSKDDGNFWYDVNNGLPGTFIYKAWGIGDYLYLSLPEGLWRRPFNEMFVLNFQPDTLTLNWSLSSTDTLFIQATGNWSIQGQSLDWFELDKLQGEGDDTILCFAMKENLSGTDNIATLSVSSEYLEGVTLYVVQTPKPQSVEDNHSIKVRVYPNPASSSIIVMSDCRISEISIINEHGAISKEVMKDCNLCKLDLAGLTRGMYFLKITTNKGVVVEKIILN